MCVPALLMCKPDEAGGCCWRCPLTRLFMAGRATPSPRPTIARAAMTAGSTHRAVEVCAAAGYGGEVPWH